MIGELHARSQVDRFSGLKRYFSAEDREAAERELVHVLRHADNPQIAAIAVNRWLDDSVEWPKPMELRVLVDRVNAEIRQESRDIGRCEVCDGVGLTIIRVGQYSGAKPCECLPVTHHARPGLDPHEGEYWKPWWRYQRTEAY